MDMLWFGIGSHFSRIACVSRFRVLQEVSAGLNNSRPAHLTKNYEENGYGHDLESGVVSYRLHVSHPGPVSHPTRSGCRAECVNTLAYLTCLPYQSSTTCSLYVV